MVPMFVEGVPDYQIRREIMYISAGGFVMAMPLADFIAGHTKSADVIRAYYARKGEVVRLRASPGHR